MLKISVMDTNWLIVVSTTLIPLFLGFVWYHPKVFGTVWMKEAGITDTEAKQVNIAKVLVLTAILGVLAAVSVFYNVVHHAHIFSAVMNVPDMNNPDSELGQMLARFMELYGNNFRTFKHGALHGTILGITVALPIIAINGMFERKSWIYISINAGYWILSFALMGGVICGFA